MNRLISLLPIVLDDKPVVACPFCSRVNVHPTSIRCNPAGEMPGQVRIENVGVLWDGNAEPDGRGVRIDLFFACEGGHNFGVMLHFHKGRTEVKRILDPTDSPSNVIWRS